ncbi:MAG: 50S ribosomal protein L9 [Actinomycetes bacterium]|jgi:large subunit ribosomal protein L9|uniref:50S ribosomal protein L9 n=1 Tax=freshwater metagenome TaxID=449393 RepID=A0A6J6FBE5_9ZZZZ|nr:50S ribosomal protein L9 [Actinomycetota bacterium]
MKVILRSDLSGVGKRGDIVDVADGHARNYLLPRGLALVATDGAVNQAKAMRRARDLRDAADRESAQTIASALVARTITISAKAGSEGKLFGSVTTADIAQAIHAQANISIDRKKLHVEPIKSLGTYSVAVKLHSDVEFPVSVEVVKA